MKGTPVAALRLSDFKLRAGQGRLPDGEGDIVERSIAVECFQPWRQGPFRRELPRLSVSISILLTEKTMINRELFEFSKEV